MQLISKLSVFDTLQDDAFLLDSIPTLTSRDVCQGVCQDGLAMDIDTFDYVKSESLQNLTSLVCLISYRSRNSSLNTLALKCPNLKTFFVRCCSPRRILDEPDLFMLKNLTKLHINNLTLSDAMAVRFADLNFLTQLSLCRVKLCHLQHHEGFGHALAKTSLQRIELDQCFRNNLKSILTLLDDGHQLQWLRIVLLDLRGNNPQLFKPLINRCSGSSNPRSYHIRWCDFEYTNGGVFLHGEKI